MKSSPLFLHISRCEDTKYLGIEQFFSRNVGMSILEK
jgi:hypothetical protein